MTVLDVTQTDVKTLEKRMVASRRRLVGAVNVVEGGLALVALVWTYGLAERVVRAQEAAAQEAAVGEVVGGVGFAAVQVEPASGPGGLATVPVEWWGPDFSLSVGTSLLLVGAAAAVAGSIVQQSIVFADRAGRETLERGYLWWYALRPVWSALLGIFVVLAVNAGLVSIGDDTTSTAAIPVLMTTGAVAGLFTDQALQRLRSLLGASDPRVPGSAAPIP